MQCFFHVPDPYPQILKTAKMHKEQLICCLSKDQVIDLYKILYDIWNFILSNHNLIQIADISIYDNANMIHLYSNIICIFHLDLKMISRKSKGDKNVNRNIDINISYLDCCVFQCMSVTSYVFSHRI